MLQAISPAQVAPVDCSRSWQVSTNRYAELGILKGDFLVIDKRNWQQNGAWLLLCFNGNYYIRALQCLPGIYRLLPLAGNLQSMDWPVWESLPLVGRIARIERELDNSAR